MSIERVILSWGMVASLFCATGHAQPLPIGCPPMHDGHRLSRVGLFDGHPSELAELVPGKDRMVVPAPYNGWTGPLSQYTLGCMYAGTEAVVVVPLPIHVRTCDYVGRVQVACR